jgi:phospholipase C
MLASDRIAHVVVLMMENRSFDHFFGYRPGVNGLKGTYSNLLNPAKPHSVSNPEYHAATGATYATTSGQGPFINKLYKAVR